MPASLSRPAPPSAGFPPAPESWCVVGHRGAAGLAPENTLASFRRAVELGVDAVELDVHWIGGALVVLHDDRVDRTTDGQGLASSLGLDRLRQLDAGGGERIPLLDEVLAEVPAETGVNVELKGAGTAAPVAERLRGERRRLLVSSFDHDELARFHRACPECPCAPLFGRWGDVAGAAARVDAAAVNIGDRLAVPDRIDAIRRLGLACLVYTVNDPARASALRAGGASGVFTDYPDRVRREG